MEALLREILDKINVIESSLSKTNERLSILESKQDNNHNEIIKRLDNLEALVTDLDPKNANRHVIIENSIIELHKDIKFIKHKLHVNEEEIFDIKDHLKLVK